MAQRPQKRAERPQAEARAELFVNEPSSLDERTHAELQMMHRESSAAILFAKSIQWRSVGAALLVDGAIIALALLTAADQRLVTILIVISLLLACGVVFVLVMYQFWQINEITKLNAIEREFSTLYARIARLKSRREGNVHRYTLLLFMIVVVVLGAVVANLGIQQALTLPK